MSRLAGLSDKSFFKKKSEIWAKYGQWCYGFNFVKGIRLHWLFHKGFGEIRFWKWLDVIISNSWFLEILKGFSEGLPLLNLNNWTGFQANNFFLKLKRILTKIDISCVKPKRQSDRRTHPLASIWCKLLEDSICEWNLK